MWLCLWTCSYRSLLDTFKTQRLLLTEERTCSVSKNAPQLSVLMLSFLFQKVQHSQASADNTLEVFTEDQVFFLREIHQKELIPFTVSSVRQSVVRSCYPPEIVLKVIWSDIAVLPELLAVCYSYHKMDHAQVALQELLNCRLGTHNVSSLCDTRFWHHWDLIPRSHSLLKACQC